MGLMSRNTMIGNARFAASSLPNLKAPSPNTPNIPSIHKATVPGYLSKSPAPRLIETPPLGAMMPTTEVSMSKQKKQDRGRFSAKRKVATVLRLLKGEDLDTLSRELGVTAAKLPEWRDDFLAGGEAGLKSREPSVLDDENQRVKAKLGELLMDNELLRVRAGIDPFPWGKSRG